jgi:phage shock protein E
MPDSPQFISEKDAWDKINAGAFVLDVRKTNETLSGVIPGAVVIPHTELPNNMDKIPSDKNTEIVCYCAVGGRSEMAKQYLESEGYTSVFNAGGYQSLSDWEQKN